MTDRCHTLNRQSPLPLWAQLQEDLRNRIEAGDFVDALPTELALASSYGVSRNTVRDALRQLRTDGIVVAGRGRRPRLARQVAIEQPLGALHSLYSSVEAAGFEATSIVRTLGVRRDQHIARRLELPDRAPLVYLERIRLADGQPLAIDRAWFPAEIAEPLLTVDFTRVGFYDELSSRTGIRLTGGDERFYAVMLSESERSLLDLPPHMAAFAIERLGLVRERPVEWRRTVVRGDRFSVVAHFSAGAGYRLDIGTLSSRPHQHQPLRPRHHTVTKRRPAAHLGKL
ncbi:MAG: GntR family transcriptional regulator [Solirubrobacteraceae bacterium]